MNQGGRAGRAFTAALSLAAGGIAGYFAWWAYWRISLIPDAAWRPIASSPIMMAIDDVSSDLVIPTLFFIRALPTSLLIGLVAGLLATRLRYTRLFCYSALIWPVAYLSYGYLALSQLEEIMGAYVMLLWSALRDHQMIAAAVFAWYFIGLYLSRALTSGRCGTRDGR